MQQFKIKNSTKELILSNENKVEKKKKLLFSYYFGCLLPRRFLKQNKKHEHQVQIQMVS